MENGHTGTPSSPLGNGIGAAPQPTTDIQTFLHEFRKQIDACIKVAEGHQTGGLPYGRELALVRTKLQEAKMWAGKCLEVWGAPFPADLRDEAK